jgi:hypothetical protein
METFSVARLRLGKACEDDAVASENAPKIRTKFPGKWLSDVTSKKFSAAQHLSGGRGEIQ